MNTLITGSLEDAKPIFLLRPDDLEGDLEFLSATQKQWMLSNAFAAAKGELLSLPDENGVVSGVLFGLGKEADISPLIFGSLPKSLAGGDYFLSPKPSNGISGAQIGLGWALGDYSFDKYTSKPVTKARFVLTDPDVASDLGAISKGVTLARDLINTPANDLGPAELSKATQSLANQYGASFSEIVGEDLVSQNFPLIYAVGQGSDRIPRLIDFTWGDPEHPKVTLVGKGVIFDTGGLDIKPPSAMLLMKKDMGGAANVLGLALMIMEQNIPVRLRVLIPAVENAISGNAFRPGDVFTSRKGQSVEIGNTDAEGRLVLADALALACEEAPELIIDMATLTGAARVALGPDLPPFFTDDDELAHHLMDASRTAHDPLWQLPLWSAYDAMLDSKVADFNNVSSGGFAGAITAALFLRRFVNPDVRWLHLDIFGWSPSAKPGVPEGGAAQAIRALFHVLRERYATSAV